MSEHPNDRYSGIGEPGPHSQDPDEKTREEATRLARDGREHDLRLKGLEQDIDERKRYAAYIFWLVVGWLTFVLLIVIVNGFQLKVTNVNGLQFSEFGLPEAVLIALLTTATATIVGILIIVARYLFRDPPETQA